MRLEASALWVKKYIFGILLALVLAFAGVFAYELTESDNELLDRVEKRIIDIIDDETNSITPEVFVAYVDRILDTRDLTSRQEVLLEIIADDIAWEYEIGDYSEESYEAMSEEDCYEDEYYDSEDEYCYYIEDEDYDDEVEYEAGDTHSHGVGEGDAPVLAKYSVDGDRITLISGEDDIKNQEVWNIFTALIPASARKDITVYETSHDPDGDTMAHVEQVEGDQNNWLMNVNLGAFYIDGVLQPEDTYATLIHEYAHVLTLGKTQVRYVPEGGSDEIYERFASKCLTDFVGEGCLMEDAYMYDFVKEFWSDVGYRESVRNEEIYAYDDNPDHFVTDYAATNPGEDIAESFTYFVLRARAEGDSVADKKIKFFYDYKELDSLRKQIRSNLAKLK